MDQTQLSGSASRSSSSIGSINSHISLGHTEKPQGGGRLDESQMTNEHSTLNKMIDDSETPKIQNDRKSFTGTVAMASRTSIEIRDEKKDTSDSNNCDLEHATGNSSIEREPNSSAGSKQTVASTVTDGDLDSTTKLDPTENSGLAVGSASAESSDFYCDNQNVEQNVEPRENVDSLDKESLPISPPAPDAGSSSVGKPAATSSVETSSPKTSKKTIQTSGQDSQNSGIELNSKSPSSQLTEQQIQHAQPTPPNSTSNRDVSMKTDNVPQQMTDTTTPNNSAIEGNASNLDSKNLDSILQSPPCKDEIVEKSPGGRYLRFSEKLGSGAYKDVYRAYDTSEGIEVAWNVVNLTGVPKSERQYIVNEVRLLEKLNHSNIISFHGSWVNRGLDQVIFVTEILSSGTLKSFINKVQVIRYKIAKRWAIQILKGLEYLHSNDPPIIHRDLKCDNIFINGTSGDLRIGDLGLSTVISKKSQVLSVLGTPEFMAPELYNESYNEKVDIYAFGMCMLEIFTKEAPYRECSNPAQIYKKVSNGIEPESLRRIRSDDARDFIRQCLGTTDENGAIVRPSAASLLAHPFLEKRQTDDSEVDLEPLLAERAISEQDSSSEMQPTVYVEPQIQVTSDSDRTAETGKTEQNSSAENPVNVDTNVTHSISVTDSSVNPMHHPSEGSDDNAPTDVVQKQTMSPQKFREFAQQASFDFENMPEAEINMKPVKVMMGRGQELNETNDMDQSQVPNEAKTVLPVSAASSIVPPPSPPLPQPVSKPVVNDDNAEKDSLESAERRNSQVSTESQEPNPSKYSLVAAVVDTNDPTGVFPGDIMQLRMTLTVGGVEQHIQFGFHLVQDDAIQVAKEMVTELNLPTDAVLETSEIISSMARNARIQQDNYKTIMQQQALPNRPHPVNNVSNVNPVFGTQGNTVVNQANAVNYDNHLERSIDASISSLPDPQMIVPPPINQALFPLQNITPAHPQTSANYDNRLDRSLDSLPPLIIPAGATSDAFPQSSLQPNGISHVNPPSKQVQPRSSSLPSTTATVLTAPEAIGIGLPPPHGSTPIHSHKLPNGESNSSTIAVTSQGTLLQQPVATHQNPVAPTKSSSGVVKTIQAPSQETIQSQAVTNQPSPTLEVSAIEVNDEVEEDETSSAELIQLKQEHDKKVQRAKKAFGTRMGNLQRSREEKEALHQKQLQKHEKEKAALEKRLKMAEVEQQQRIQKLEKEFHEQREIAKQYKKANPNAPLPSPSDEDDVAMTLESKVSNMNLLSMNEKSVAGGGSSEQVAKTPVVKTPSSSNLSQEGGETIVVTYKL